MEGVRLAAAEAAVKVAVGVGVDQHLDVGLARLVVVVEQLQLAAGLLTMRRLRSVQSG